MVIANVLHSMQILGDTCDHARRFMIEGTELNRDRIAGYVEHSVMPVTALAPADRVRHGRRDRPPGRPRGPHPQRGRTPLAVSTSELFDRVVVPLDLTRPKGDDGS